MNNKDRSSLVKSFFFNQNSRLTSGDSKRDTLLTIIGALASFILFMVAVASFMRSDYSTATIDIVASALILGLIAAFRLTRYKTLCKFIGVAVMYSLYLYLFLTGAAKGTTYMWHYTFPFFAIFLIGANHGAIATLALFIPVFAKIILDAQVPETSMYSPDFAIRFIPSVSVALIFAYLFEKERERFRQQSLQAHREQEQIIQERTDQLVAKIEERDRMAEKLRLSQKMEAIGTMASGVAHDLNNILSGIVTYPQLIRNRLPAGSPLAKQLVSIEQSGKRAAAVVDDLLTIARNAASVKEPFDLNLLIKDLLASPEWCSSADLHPLVEVKTKLDGVSGIVMGSQVHIRKCLMNLLLNGIEATGEGLVTIATQVIYKEDTAHENAVRITIDDNGPGIAQEHLEHIFEPFYTTKKMGKSGTGLGLSVVWNTVEDHGGTIKVTNQDPGVRFEVILPTSTDQVPLKNDTYSYNLGRYQGTGTILVVDDEPHLREIASEIVLELGYSVSAVASGEEALALLKRRPVDLVLLDMILGEGMGGLQTYQKMIALNPLQKAIIVSGYSTSEEVQKTLEMGAFSIIKKPYTLEEIGRAIKECMGNVPTAHN